MEAPKLSLQFLKEFKKNYSQFVSHLIDKYGGAVKVQGPFNKNLHFFADPKFISHVLLEKSDIYVRPPNKVIDSLLLEPGLSRSQEHTLWKFERFNIINPVLTEKAVGGYIDIIIDNAERHMKEWETSITRDQPIAINLSFLSMTLENFLKSIFAGVPVDLQQVTYLVQEFHFLLVCYEKSTTGIEWMFPSSVTRRMNKMIKELHAIGKEIIAYSLASPEDNIVKSMANKFTGPAQNLQMHLLTRTVALLVGGFDSVAIDLTWLFINLSRFPLIAKKIHDEVKSVVGDRRLTLADVDKLHYTQAVVQESLRLSSLAFIPRMALENDVIDGYKVNQKDRILIPTFYLHRQPEYWENPEGFNPDRFLKPLDDRYRFIYMPFSTGPRGCLGRNFALIQLKAILALVSQKYHLYLTPNQTIDPHFHYFDPRLRANIMMNVSHYP